MPSVNVQFHMLMNEVIDFVTEMGDKHSLSIELERWHPKAISAVPAGADLAATIRSFGIVNRIWLLYTPTALQPPERFMLNVGTMRENRLSQAQLGAGTNNPAAFSVLKSIAAELKRRTKLGIWVVSKTGHIAHSKSSRVSSGAAEASRRGEIELTDIAFMSSILVDRPE